MEGNQNPPQRVGRPWMVRSGQLRSSRQIPPIRQDGTPRRSPQFFYFNKFADIEELKTAYTATFTTTTIIA